MALGFQDCCNTSNYFYLNGIPATVSEFEVYYIETTQGEKFCASYVNVPTLNYSPPTYDLNVMTQQVNCETCIGSYPCPTEETIFLTQFGSGSIATGTDCYIKTIFPMFVECRPTNPSALNLYDGQVSLYITGGTTPYVFYSAGTNNVIGPNSLPQGNIFTVFPNATQGTYSITIYDKYGDFIETINCVLDAAPSELGVNCTPTDVSIYGENDGQLNVQAFGGTPPYIYIYNGSEVTLPVTGLTAGIYTLTVNDSGEGDDLQTITVNCEITEPEEIIYPDDLCLQFNVCGTNFNLNFSVTGQLNNRPLYTLNNPTTIGVTSMTLSYGTNGWSTNTQVITSTPQFGTACNIPNSNTISFKSSTPFAEQPTGVWNGFGLFANQIGNVSEGLCVNNQPSVQVINQTNASCTNNVGNVTLQANGGSGAPYTYYLNNIPQNGPTISNLIQGTYSAYVIDSSGFESDPINFTITQQQPSIISMNFSSTLEDEILDGPTTINAAGGPYSSCYETYRRYKFNVAVNNIPSNQTITGYFIFKTKYQGAFTNFYPENLWQGGGATNILISDYKINNITQTIPSSTLITNQSLVRPNGILPSFIPVIQSSECSPGQTSRKVIRQITTNSITIDSNTTIEFDLTVQSLFRPEGTQPSHGGEPLVNGCTPGSALEFEVEFVKTSADINCYNFVFNNNQTPYRRSSKQTGPQLYLGNLSFSNLIS